MRDPAAPDVEYLAATRLLISDGAQAILSSHDDLAGERVKGGYGGTAEHDPTVGSWYVFVRCLCSFGVWVCCAAFVRRNILPSELCG